MNTDEENQAKYDAMGHNRMTASRSDRNDRANQDKYDVAQAKHEYESMHLPHREEDEFLEPDFSTTTDSQGNTVDVLTLEELERKLNDLAAKYEELKSRFDESGR